MDLDRIANLQLDNATHRYEVRDTILYALGLGYGMDPLDESELRYVYEDGLKVVPSICSVLGHPGFWLKDPVYKVNWVKVLHAEQEFTIHRSLSVSADVRAEFRVVGVEDKGIDKGALLHVEKTLYDSADGTKLATVRATTLLRGDGGQGGMGSPVRPAEPLAAGNPDHVVEISTLPGAALIYRLSGDWNPLHADPRVARRAGFERPILHGLCTFGVACRAILRALCHDEPARLKSMFARFSSPVFPGETIRVEFFDSGDQVRFRAVAKERGTVVLDRCSAIIAR